jgi:hypothetical protein
VVVRRYVNNTRNPKVRVLPVSSSHPSPPTPMSTKERVSHSTVLRPCLCMASRGVPVAWYSTDPLTLLGRSVMSSSAKVSKVGRLVGSHCIALTRCPPQSLNPISWRTYYNIQYMLGATAPCSPPPSPYI